MTYIFRCKTNEAYRIKILAELLSNNMKTGCFVVDEKGITLRMMDHHRSILIDLNLQANNFNLYKLESESKLYKASLFEGVIIGRAIYDNSIPLDQLRNLFK